MDKEIHFCEICGNPIVEDHHIVFKSECKPMDKCYFNHTWLCNKHHQDHKAGVHHNRKLNIKLKLRVQAKLESLFDKEWYMSNEIQNKLKISSNATRSLCKLMTSRVGLYKRNDIIRTVLGGKMYE
jgi:hypothetical protein